MTMTKTRLLLLASVPFTIAMTLSVFAMLPPRPGVTKANFDRIEKGMTRAEVEEIFGGKGTTWETFWMRSDADIHKEMTKAEMHEMFVREGKGWQRFIMRWGEDDGAQAGILIQNDCVVAKQWFDSNETFLDKVRRWLHLR
jgi:hypothetical protein